MPSVGPGLTAAVAVDARAWPRFSCSTFLSLASAPPLAMLPGNWPMLRSRVAPRRASSARAAPANPEALEVTL